MYTRGGMKKFVLAYSGGLDTSIIVRWLREHYECQVICVCVNTGNLGNLDTLRRRAAESGAYQLVIIDAREEFITDYLFPMIRARARYEEQYLLGTAIARPLQAGHQVRIALQEDATAVAHGCTGKGNDQVRFELCYRALAPHLKVIAPWRLWDIDSREKAIEYAERHGISLDGISRDNIYSRDSNVWHMSHEGGSLEDISHPAERDIYRLTHRSDEWPDSATDVTIRFEHAIPVAVDGASCAPLELLDRLNALAGKHGIGRVDIVEDRIIGIKSRGVYETPGGTVLYYALRELEAVTLDSEMREAKRLLADRYAKLVYEGKWYSPLRASLDAFMEQATKYVSGAITLSLYKGAISVHSRLPDAPIYKSDIASFDTGEYSPADASGFVQLYGLETELLAQQAVATPPPDKSKSRTYTFEQ